MGLPVSNPRQAMHTRNIAYKGYLREDGLWDIEGELVDSKPQGWDSPEKGKMSPGQAVHRMLVRVVVSDDFEVVQAHAAMPDTPFPECTQATVPVRLLVGATLKKGWRQAIEAAMGDVRGCTHLRELLHGIGTAAYQTIGPAREKLELAEPGRAMPARHLGQCISWDFGSDVVKRHKPWLYKAPKDTGG